MPSGRRVRKNGLGECYTAGRSSECQCVSALSCGAFAWQDEAAGKSRDYGAVSYQSDSDSGIHYSYRSRGGRAKCQCDGDRECRAFWSGSVAPAQRPCRPRQNTGPLLPGGRAKNRRRQTAYDGYGKKQRWLCHSRRRFAPARCRRSTGHPTTRPAGSQNRRPGTRYQDSGAE